MAQNRPHPTTEVTEAELERLAKLFTAGPSVIMTGAGLSTDSGIPDYRGQGTPPRTPMSVGQFLSDPHYRQRFWAGASVGTRRTRHIRPNEGHAAAARLERAGLITGVITQNTDGLHRAAGATQVAELNGSGALIRCLPHGHRWTRREVLSWFDVANEGYVERNLNVDLTPDGDAAVTDVDQVVVPVCPACGGTLRSDVVYFGEHVPVDVFSAAERLLADADSFIVAGSSLAVNTGIRLVNRAEQRGLPIGVINRGVPLCCLSSGLGCWLVVEAAVSDHGVHDV